MNVVHLDAYRYRMFLVLILLNVITAVETKRSGQMESWVGAGEGDSKRNVSPVKLYGSG